MVSKPQGSLGLDVSEETARVLFLTYGHDAAMQFIWPPSGAPN
jgi:hypothetical protein